MKSVFFSILLIVGSSVHAEATMGKGPEVACYVSGYQYNLVKKISNNTQKEDQYFDNVRFPLYEGPMADCKAFTKQFALDHTGLHLNVTFTSPCKSTSDAAGFLVQMTDGGYNYSTAYPVSPTETQMQSYFVSNGKTFDLQIYCIQD